MEEAFSGGARGGRAAPSGAPQQEQQQHAGGRSHGHGRQQQGGSGGLGDGVEGLRRRPAAPPPQEEAPLDPSVTLEQQELVVRILKAKGLAPQLPEDLYQLIKKAVSVRKHLEINRKDKDSKFRLILIESRIHRLARYYKRARQLPPNWKYESATASALVA